MTFIGPIHCNKTLYILSLCHLFTLCISVDQVLGDIPTRGQSDRIGLRYAHLDHDTCTHCSVICSTSHSDRHRPLTCGIYRRKHGNNFVFSVIPQYWIGAGFFIFSLNEDKNPPVWWSQYQACWWPGDLSRQGISRHGIDMINSEYPITYTGRVNSLHGEYLWFGAIPPRIQWI